MSGKALIARRTALGGLLVATGAAIGVPVVRAANRPQKQAPRKPVPTFASHRQRFLAEQGYSYRIIDADDLDALDRTA